MSGVNSPEFACGQMLFSIKMSKLNYLVQETPYSIHVTLRKKFVEEVTNIGTSDFDSITLGDTDVEVTSLKQRLKI